MYNRGYYTDLLSEDDETPSFDYISNSMTQETPEIEDIQTNASAQRKYVPRPNAKRQKKFSPDEDSIVVSAWLNVSKDPVHGTNQTHASFWQRILAFYEANRGSYPSRTESSIMHRWMYILENVNKFCSCYDMVERRNQSGTTIQDKISEAMSTFKGLHKDKSFSLLHCWNMLKSEDKWMKELADLKSAANNKRRKINKDSTPSPVEESNNEPVSVTPSPEFEAPKRPQGQKKAKEALRRGGGEACMEAFDKMWAKKETYEMEKEKKKEERFMAALEIEKKRLALEEKKMSLEEKKWETDLLRKEDKIMSMDMTSLNSLQQKYYLTMQEQIIARRSVGLG